MQCRGTVSLELIPANIGHTFISSTENKQLTYSALLSPVGGNWRTGGGKAGRCGETMQTPHTQSTGKKLKPQFWMREDCSAHGATTMPNA